MLLTLVKPVQSLLYTFLYIYVNNKKNYFYVIYATYKSKNAIIKANKPVASEKAKPNIA